MSRFLIPSFKNVQISTIFAIVGLIFFIGLAVALGYIFKESTTFLLVKLEQQKASKLSRFISNSTFDEAQVLIELAHSLTKEQLIEHPKTKELFQNIIQNSDGIESIMKVKIFDLKRKTVFSTEPKQTAEIKDANYSGLAASQGEIISHISLRDKFKTWKEERTNVYVLSSYLPLKKSTTEEIIGVIEVYSDISPLITTISDTSKKIAGFTSMVFILVYVLIYLILRKAEMASQKNFQIVEAQRARMISSSKLASIGEMAGGIAHEINNPLMIIHGYAEQIQDSLNQKKVGQKEIYEASQKIIHTSKRISSIVASLKRLGSPQKSDVFEEASVTNIINDSLDLCRNKFSNAGIKLEFHPEMELKAICRSVEVSQAILNLLSNSYDAIEKTTDPWVIIKAIKKDQFVQISITDSGNGIKPEIATKIMEPFFTTKKEGRGTGLGLSISHRLIQDQNGSLFVDLKSRNTCFVIQIPSADKLKAIA